VVAAEHAAGAVRDGTILVDARAVFALCTHRFDHDQAWLEAAIATESPYIGVLGSRQRATRLVRSLSDAGRPLRARDRARLFAPIGLDIGAESPDEIGLAAIAEMQAVLESRPGGSLRDRTTPLHARTDTPVQHTDTFAVVCQNPLPPPRDRR
jgi:xanthine/CO dehydrogenase XdhC/CoxF family maturation factor